MELESLKFSRYFEVRRCFYSFMSLLQLTLRPAMPAMLATLQYMSILCYCSLKNYNHFPSNEFLRIPDKGGVVEVHRLKPLTGSEFCLLPVSSHR